LGRPGYIFEAEMVVNLMSINICDIPISLGGLYIGKCRRGFEPTNEHEIVMSNDEGGYQRSPSRPPRSVWGKSFELYKAFGECVEEDSRLGKERREKSAGCEAS